jgi:acyl-CoA thioesterase
MAENYENETIAQEESSPALPSNYDEKIELKAYNLISQSLCGTVEELRDGYARIKLIANDEMAVDKKGLIHSGFVFAAANFAAVAAVNKANVILAVAQCNFLAPLKVEDEVIFEATTQQLTARKRTITVIGTMNNIKVFVGDFSVVITDKHVLNLHLLDN